MGVEISEELAKQEGKDDDRLTVSQLSPGKTVGESRYRAETSDWNDGGIRPNPAPGTRTSVAPSPMRPSRKRAASAEQESDTEPGGAWTGEWEKRCLITESNREGEVRGGGEGKQVGEKPQRLPVPSREENGVASRRSLTITRRLRAKAVRESPRVRKLRDKLERRVGAGGRGLRGGAPEVSRGRDARLDACSFPENIGASGEGKGSDRVSTGETIGPGMPYNGDNVSFLCFFPGWDGRARIFEI